MFLHVFFENKKIILSIKDEQFNETQAVEYALEYNHADQLVSKISEIVPNTKSIRGIVVTKKENVTSLTLQRMIFTVVNILGYALKVPIACMNENTSFDSLKWQKYIINHEYKEVIT